MMDIDDNILTSAATASSLGALRTGNGASSSTASLSELSEVQVKFVTRNPELPQVPDTFLNVPVKLARYGLSEIVNALTNTDPPRPFDFLIRGQFLRSDLLRYLTKSGLSGEGGLELEYVEAAPEPESNPSRPHPDWIASLDARGGRGQYVVTGCYDSVVRVFDAQQSKAAAIALGVGHGSAVKSVAVFRGNPSAGVKQEGKPQPMQIVSGSKDRAVRVWSFTPGQAHLKCIAQCEAHTDSVEAVAIAKGTDVFCSGGWDHNVNVWDITNADTKSTTSEEVKEDAPAAKKRKKSDSSSSSTSTTPTHIPLRTLSGHIAAVTALTYPHPASIYSGSMDHNLKQWDIETGNCMHTWFGRQVVTSLDFSLESNVLGSGHHDKVVRIWDPRQAEKEVMKLQLKSHKGWVSGVKFHPTRAHQLATSSYDHSVKIWDMRSNLPLFTLQAHTDKALTLDWMDETHLWSGGADNQLQTHTMKV